MEDAILVFKFRQGSKDALCRIYEKYRDYMLVLAIALCHNKSSAEDAVHDVFVSFAEKAVDFKLTGNLRSYLSTCVANRIRDIMKSKHSRAVSLDDDCPFVSDADEPSNAIICNEELQQLSASLAKLPYEQSEVIALHIYGKMKFSAIAKSLGVSANTIKGRYRYGIEKLRLLLATENTEVTEKKI
jgi:RNA polymerase sigma-70 factor (ECF subfamily)